MAHTINNLIKGFLNRTVPFLNLPYEVQIKMKENRCANSIISLSKLLKKSNRASPDLLEYLKKNSGLPCEIDLFKPSLNRDEYRNKMEASVGIDIDSNVAIGRLFTLKGKKVIGRLPEMFYSTRYNIIIKLFERFIKEHSEFRPNLDDLSRPYMSDIMIRSNRCHECMIHIKVVADPSVYEDLRDKAREELLGKFLSTLNQEKVNVKSFYMQLRYDVAFSQSETFPSEHIYGDEHIIENICGRNLFIGPMSNFKANTDVAEVLYENTRVLVRDSLNQSTKNRLILELCCGIGSLGIILSDTANKVIGVDKSMQSIQEARYNALSNDIGNVDFVCQDAEEFMSEFIKTGIALEYDEIVAVISPSRYGLTSKFCEYIRQCRTLNTVLYSTCRLEKNSYRNLYQLCKISSSRRLGNHFTMKRVVPMDMLVYTKFVQLVIKLQR